MVNSNNTLAFKCFTQESNESCGSLGSVKCYLINSQTDKRYRVTVRETFNNSSSDFRDKIHIIEAGSRVLVGCNKTTTNGYNSIMVKYNVIGEIQI